MKERIEPMSGYDFSLVEDSVCGFRAFVEKEKRNPNIRNRTRTAVRISIFGVLCFFFW